MRLNYEIMNKWGDIDSYNIKLDDKESVRINAEIIIKSLEDETNTFIGGKLENMPIKNKEELLILLFILINV